MMNLSGAMMLFLALFFLWNGILVIELLVRYDFAWKERLCLFGHMFLCAGGVALFGTGTIYEIIRLVRMYG